MQTYPHADDTHIERGISTQELEYGNNRAGHYAGKGAAIYELTDLSSIGYQNNMQEQVPLYIDIDR